MLTLDSLRYGDKTVRFVSSTRLVLPRASGEAFIPDAMLTLYFSDGSGQPMTLQISELATPLGFFSEDPQQKALALQQILDNTLKHAQ